MENRELSVRYAKTLHRADSAGVVDADVLMLVDCLQRSERMLALFQDVMVPSQAKLLSIRNAFGGNLNATLDRFMALIAKKNRMDQLLPILKEFLRLRDSAHGAVKGLVRMAVPLSTEALKSLEKTLSATLGRPCELETILDDSLIGGFTVRVEDTVYDSSVRTQLDILKTRFLNLAG